MHTRKKEKRTEKMKDTKKEQSNELYDGNVSSIAASYHKTYGYHIINNELVQTEMRMTFIFYICIDAVLCEDQQL